MTVLSTYKRECNKSIGGCGKEIDITTAVTVSKGTLHLCKCCAGAILRRTIKCPE
jgi:hypothetical protein